VASLTEATTALATEARADGDVASLSAGVDGLATGVAALASGFGALQTSLNRFAPELDGLYADAATPEAMVEGLEALGMSGG
jgi:hypothetical protein